MAIGFHSGIASDSYPHHLTLRRIIASLRSSQWDVRILYGFYERLADILTRATASEREEFDEVTRMMWKHCAASNDMRDLAFRLGVLLGVMGHYETSVEYFQYSRPSDGATAKTEFNIGLSYWRLGKMEGARQCMSLALALDDRLDAAKRFLMIIDALSNSACAATSETGIGAARKTALRRLEKYEFIREQVERPEIYLEPLRPDHAPALYANATPEILRLARVPVVSSPREALDWIYFMIADSNKYGFAIMHRALGFTGVISASVMGNAAGFFFWVGKAHWGHGYATAAVSKLIRFAFDGLSLERLFTCAFHHNEPSIHILDKSGFRRVETPHRGLHYYQCGISESSDQVVRHQLQQMLKAPNYKIEEASQWPK